MKRKVSKFKKHNVCNTDNWEAATRCLTKKTRSQKFGNTHRETPALECLRNKFSGHQSCNFIKKRGQNRRTPPLASSTYHEIPKNIHSEEHLGTAASDNSYFINTLLI